MREGNICKRIESGSRTHSSFSNSLDGCEYEKKSDADSVHATKPGSYCSGTEGGSTGGRERWKGKVHNLSIALNDCDALQFVLGARLH